MNLPPYAIFPSITGDRISLRQIEPVDLPELVAISFYDGVQASSLEQAAEMLAKIDQDYRAGQSIHWGISDKVSDKIVGTCGYYRGFENGEGELGCVLLPRFTGQGFMTAAMQLAIDFGLREIGLKRVRAITAKHNERARRLLGRLRFVEVAALADELLEYERRAIS